AKARVGGVSARAWSVAGAGAMWVPVIARPEPTVATRQSLAETHEPATGGGCVGNPRWTRDFATTAGSVRNASTRRRPPHSLHRRTSMAKTRTRSAAQGKYPYDHRVAPRARMLLSMNQSPPLARAIPAAPAPGDHRIP